MSTQTNGIRPMSDVRCPHSRPRPVFIVSSIDSGMGFLSLSNRSEFTKALSELLVMQ